MRDRADNFVVICSIENFDPMGIHTGDSVTVAPAQTLTDREYQVMRNASRRIIREVGVETGGSNIQFAVDPRTGRMVVIEMNPRVSRSSALASKATGFPIAKIAALLAIGYRLDEIQNDITRVTPACFEPVLDYVVVKIPRWAFEKFPDASPSLGTQMKSVGEVMAIGRTFKEALHKGLRGLETGISGFARTDLDDDRIKEKLLTPDPDRIFYVKRALDLGWPHGEIHRMTGIDPWFLDQLQQIVDLEKRLGPGVLDDPALLRESKRMGFSDARLGQLAKTSEGDVRRRRQAAGIVPVYKRVDTCAAEFVSHTPYLYSTYERECEADPTDRKKVVILGSGPNRIGQGIEFDYCCCHASFAFKEEGYETIMINCNPETVSTDYDTSDRLYFEPLAFEDVMNVARAREAGGRRHPVRRPDSAAPGPAAVAGGREDPGHEPGRGRPRGGPEALQRPPRRAGHPPAGERHRDLARGGEGGGGADRLPRARAPELRAGRAGHGHRVRRVAPRGLRARGGEGLARAPHPRRPLPGGRVRGGRGRARGRRARGDRGDPPAHRGGGHPQRRLRDGAPDVQDHATAPGDDPPLHARARAGPGRARAHERRSTRSRTTWSTCWR